MAQSTAISGSMDNHSYSKHQPMNNQTQTPHTNGCNSKFYINRLLSIQIRNWFQATYKCQFCHNLRQLSRVSLGFLKVFPYAWLNLNIIKCRRKLFDWFCLVFLLYGGTNKITYSFQNQQKTRVLLKSVEIREKGAKTQ